MEEKNKWILFVVAIVVLTIFVISCIRILFPISIGKEKKRNTLSLILKGDKVITMKVGDIYKEPGYIAIDSEEGNLTSRVSVQNTLNTKIPGTYQINYVVTNQNGEKVEVKRYVKVEGNLSIPYKDSYDKIDNTMKKWWSGNKKDHSRPEQGAGNTIDILKKYNAYYIGEDKPIIYLTFDEGSNATYLEQIVDILNQNEVKATFFLCKKYIEQNPEWMKKMAYFGHSVGNHTSHHKSMPSLATRSNFEKYISEIEENEKAYQKVTGVAMDKIYRDPRGEYSYRSLQIIHDLGYQTFFYSADYYDFDNDVSKQKALEELMKRYHNGAIYLIHPKNKGNYEAMDEFIKNLKNLGYSFGLVKDIH